MNEQRHVPLLGSSRVAPVGVQSLGDVDPGERIAFTIVVRRRSDLPRELIEGPDTVSADELADRYGAEPADVDRVRATLDAAGMTVAQPHPGSRRVFGEGPASAVSALFDTQLTRVRGTNAMGEPVEHRARSGQLGVPAELDGIVTAVFGLDSRPQVRPYVRPHTKPTTPAGFDVPSLADVYDFPAGTDGTGQVAAILEFGGGYGQDDLDTFFGGLNLPTPKITAVSVDGAQNVAGQAPSDADAEVLLDVEILGALAPKAELLVYFAPNTDQGFINAISAAVHATPAPAVLSISWGMSEDQWTEQARTAMDDVFADAAALGITVCAASGDNGSEDSDTSGGQHVDFPSSSPHVLACGGTSLRIAGKERTEAVWNDGDPNTAATGGGVSDIVPLPGWQRHAGVPPRSGATTTGRGVPDVSAVGDPATGYRVRVDGKPLVLGGTSAVAPLWSALVCRFTQALGRPLGLINPVIYAAAHASRATEGFRDITRGNNGAYHARAGWDPCTGLGVPKGTALLEILRAATPG